MFCGFWALDIAQTLDVLVLFLFTLSLHCLTAVSSVTPRLFKDFSERSFLGCIPQETAWRASCIFWYTMLDDWQVVPEAWAINVGVTEITSKLHSNLQLFLTKWFLSIDFQISRVITEIQLTVNVRCWCCNLLYHLRFFNVFKLVWKRWK